MAIPEDSNIPAHNILRLKTSVPQFQSTSRSDHDTSSPEEAGSPDCLAEEDIQSVVGPSISRAQTRMMSPQTTAAEKSAAMADLGGRGFFDGIIEDKEEDICVAEPESIDQKSAEYDGNVNLPVLSDRHHGLLPPKRRDLPDQIRKAERNLEEESSGPTGILADLNVKRYMSSFSMPKVPGFNRLSVPSLASVIGSTRSHSPIRKGSRKKRASTLGGMQGELDTPEESGSQNHILNFDQSSRHHRSSRPRAQSQYASREKIDSPKTPNATVAGASRPQYLRKATSDQSLFLRRAVSTVPSLGDDSRWDNVQEQVNSRLKAIKDSFQDSAIKLPSLPNMPSFNLNPFRPDNNVRSRTQSDIRIPFSSNKSLNDTFQVNLRDTPASTRIFAADTDGVHKTRNVLDDCNSHFDRALSQLTGDVVVLGGYRGSILRSAKPPHRQLWVPVKVGLNMRKVNLEVGLEPEDEENMEKTMYPSGMLSHIGPVDMGRRFLKRLQGCKNVETGKLRVHDYGYDWRLSPSLSSRKLISFLERLPSNQPGMLLKDSGALVIAHSMGGLVTRHAINKRPELVSGVIYAGVPQHCVNILGPFRNGDDVLLSSKVLTAQVNFTMRSSFVLLPDDGVCFIDKTSKEEYPVDFFDVETWKEHAFSPCVGPVAPPFGTERKGLFGTISDSLPSLPALPLPARKSSSNAVPICTSTPNPLLKLASLPEAHPTTISAVEPSLSENSTSKGSVTTISSSSAGTSTIPTPVALRYLRRTLAETLAFRQQLAHDPALQSKNLYPPASIIYATNTPTVSRARVASRAAIRCADAYDDLQFGSGDGVVLARAAQLPKGYRCARGGRIKTERGHVGLLGDLEAVGRAIEAVLAEKRTANVGLGSRKSVDRGAAEGPE